MTGLAPVTGLTQSHEVSGLWPYHGELYPHMAINGRPIPAPASADYRQCCVCSFGSKGQGIREKERKVATCQAVRGKDESRPENVPSCPPRLFLELNLLGI